MKHIAKPAFMTFLLCMSMLGCRLFIGMPKTGWELVGSRGFSGTGGSDATLDCTATGAVIAFTDSGDQSLYSLAVRSWDGTSWTPLGSDYLSTNVYPGARNDGYMLALDASGSPVVGWIDFNNGTQTFHIRRYASGAWTAVADCPLPSTSPIFELLDMSIDPTDNQPAVLVVETSPSKFLAVYKPNGANWNSSQIGVNFPIPSFTSFARLSFDSSKNPWIDCVNIDTTPYTLEILHWNTSSWDDWSPLPAIPCNIVYDPVRFDPVGKAYVGFIWASPNTPNDDQWPRVMKQTSGTTWADLGTPPVTVYGDGSPFSFVLAPDGTPHVAVGETLDTGYHEVSVLKFDGTTWAGVGRRGFTDGRTGAMPSLSFDSAGAPWVAYSEVGNKNVKSVQKYVGGEN